uniref:Uncharacterized protein n=1 Tax=Tanacetum cinerariifolium TaxID=118510 RepID=A0A699KVA4_TANCI|nr:hypothetical protein [Tanacetum cinerariifolium]
MCWSAKKQQSVAMSSVKAEYVVIVGYCANILWMKSQLTDYDIIYEKGTLNYISFPTQYQLADIFTKPMDELTFKRLIIELDFISKCYLQEAFTRALNQYKEDLSKVYYTGKTLDDSKVWISSPIRGIRGYIGITTFSNALRAQYLPYSSETMVCNNRVYGRD